MSNPYLRQDGESSKAYLVRLCKSRVELGLTWDQLADLANEDTGSSFSSDKYRKWFEPYSEGWEDCFNELAETSADEILEEYENKRVELVKERVRLQDQNREYMNLIRKQARFEHLHNEVIDAVKVLNETKPIVTNLPKPVVISDREGVLLLSDWHKGLFASNYWNFFDEHEFKRRVRRLVVKSLEHGKIFNIQTLHIFGIGDFVNGIIHVTTRILSTQDVIKQTMEVAEVLAEVIAEFANEFNSIKYYHCRGNHDRVSPNKSDEISSESFADVILWFLKARLAHVKNLEFVNNHIDDEIVNANICGYTVYAVHGHKDRVNDVVQNLSLMTKVVPDYVFMGHIHHHEEKEIHTTEVIVNSSLSGVDSYAKDIRATSKPAQKFMVFNREEGRIHTYSIRLDI